MSRRVMMILVGLTALNAVALTINVSLPVRAEFGGKTYRDLVTDPDVQSVVQKCRVNVDIAKVIC